MASAVQLVQVHAPVFSPVEELLAEASNGRIIILVDERGASEQGHLIIPAQMATPDAVNFMARFGRGLICLALTDERAREIGLTPMVENAGNRAGAVVMTSIEATTGVTTGISSADRARTIAVAVQTGNGAADLVSPGHVFPIVATEGGVIECAGPIEAAVDLARLAGLNASGVTCTILDSQGEVACLEDLASLASELGLKIGRIVDLANYRRRKDNLVKQTMQGRLQHESGEWRTLQFRHSLDGTAYTVLQFGDQMAGKPVPLRLHRLSLLDDIVGQSDSGSSSISRLMGSLALRGSGVVILLPSPDFEVNGEGLPVDLDSFERRVLASTAQILAELDIENVSMPREFEEMSAALRRLGIAAVQEPLMHLERSNRSPD